MRQFWRTSIYWKIVSTFVLALIIPTILALIYIVGILRQQELDAATQQAYATIDEQRSQIQSMLDDVYGSLVIASQIPVITEYLVQRDDTTKGEIQQLFSVIAEEKSIYDQLRLLSPEGQELVRINRDVDGNIVVVSEDSLQDKSQRDYYEEAMQLAPNDVYISPIEANQEFGEVEQPVKPVIRYAKTLYVEDEIVGIIIFNVLIDELFDLISNDTLKETIYLISPDGEFVFTSNGDRNLLYARQLGHDSRFDTVFPTMASIIQPDTIYRQPDTYVDAENNRYITYSSVVLEQGSDPYHWFLFTNRPLNNVLDDVNRSIYSLLFLGGSTLLIALGGIALLAQGLSRPISLLHQATMELAKSRWTESKKLIRMVDTDDEISELASTFEDMLHELQEVYDTLEQRVQERTVELDEANQQLRRQEQIKTRFLEDMAHEIRTPIASLSLNAELITRNPQKQQKYLKNIIQQVQRVRMLSENIMQMARLDFSNPVQNFSTVDVEKLILLLVDVHRSLAEENDLQIITSISEDLPTIYGNYNQLSQVVDNLIVNAIKYTEKGEIQVIATHDTQTDRVCIRVQDTGIGMTDEDVARIFERYYRAKNVRQTNIHGTGLGMAIVKDIVDLHHGTIEIESTVGEGTTVSIYLPVVQPTSSQVKEVQ